MSAEEPPAGDRGDPRPVDEATMRLQKMGAESYIVAVRDDGGDLVVASDNESTYDLEKQADILRGIVNILVTTLSIDEDLSRREARARARNLLDLDPEEDRELREEPAWAP